jgi:hypothetical protein
MTCKDENLERAVHPRIGADFFNAKTPRRSAAGAQPKPAKEFRAKDTVVSLF